MFPSSRQLPTKSPLKNRLSKPSGALEFSRRFRFEFFDHRQSSLDLRDDAGLLCGRRNRDRKPLQLGHADGGEVSCMLALVEKELLPDSVGVPGNQFGVERGYERARTEDVILVNALG